MNWLGKFFNKVLNKAEDNREIVVSESEVAIQKLDLVSEEYFTDLEEKLLTLDCGIDLAEHIVDKLRKRSAFSTIHEAEQEVVNVCIEILSENHKELNIETSDKHLKIIFITGVNGSGKTTSIGKIANLLKQKGHKVLIAPCDTFRAAAQEQIKKWAERAKVDIHMPSQGDNQKADSVLFESIKKAKDEKYDTLIVDTAGRLQNKKELMDELSKLSKVIDKHTTPEDTIVHRWLVIDSTTGQNGYRQAEMFNEVSELDGIILSKFDGSAKGGIIFAIAHKLHIPIRFVGIGEKMDDIKLFHPDNFVHELIN